MKKYILVFLLALCITSGAEELKVKTLVDTESAWDFAGTIEIASLVLTATDASTTAEAVIWDGTSSADTYFKAHLVAEVTDGMAIITFPDSKLLPRMTDSVYITNRNGTGVTSGRLSIYYR